MSDRSDEVTESRAGAARSTDDLLEETETVLSGSSAEADRSSEQPADRAAPSDEPAETDSSRLSGLTPSLSLGEYFSPKAFVALVLAIGAGLLAGQTLLPIGGRIAGMVAVAFTIGLVTSRRRYLETTAAGVFVGGVAALANHTILAVAGSSRTIVAVGATAGLLSCVGGYYFGRDLRDGLLRDIE